MPKLVPPPIQLETLPMVATQTLPAVLDSVTLRKKARKSSPVTGSPGCSLSWGRLPDLLDPDHGDDRLLARSAGWTGISGQWIRSEHRTRYYADEGSGLEAE